MKRNTIDVTLASLPLVFGLILYFPSLSIWAYGDDFNHLSKSLNLDTRWNLFASTSFAFRPIEQIINSTNVTIFGIESTWFSHACSLTGYSIATMLLYWLTRLLMPKHTGIMRLLPAIYFSVMPANVMSVIQIDTVSQQYATVFTLALFGWMLSHNGKERPIDWFAYIIFGLGALLAKETAMGLILMLPFCAVVVGNLPASISHNSWLHRLSRTYTPILITFVLYWLLRWYAGASLESDTNYNVNLNAQHLMRNLIELVVGTIYTGSTLDIFPKLQPLRISLSLVLLTATSIICGLGIFAVLQRAKASQQPATQTRANLQLWLILISLVFAGTVPVIVIGHMSELYTYSSTPFYALLVGGLIGEAVASIQYYSNALRNGSKIAITVVVVSTLIWLAWGTQEKVAHAQVASERAQRYYQQLSGSFLLMPQQQRVLCWQNQSADKPGYSGFVMSDRILLRGVINFINTINHLNLAFVEEPLPHTICSHTLIVENNSVKVKAINSAIQ